MESTCKQATRHTFQVGTQDLSGFLTGIEVSHVNWIAMPSGCFDIPICNPHVWKCMLPRAFSDLDTDLHGAASPAVPPCLGQAVDEALPHDDLSSAFACWSKHAVRGLCVRLLLLLRFHLLDVGTWVWVVFSNPSQSNVVCLPFASNKGTPLISGFRSLLLPCVYDKPRNRGGASRHWRD